MRLTTRILLVWILLGFGALHILGQTESATVSGSITDSSGGVVPDARVVLTNAETNISVSTETNNTGIYSFANVHPGRYRLAVVKNGFRPVNLLDVIVHVQDAISQNFVLQIGSTSESITVTGGAPLVNTQDASVSTVVDRQFVENLPLNGRSFNKLLELTPGVLLVPSNPQSPGQFSSNGQRSSSNYFEVDGVSGNFGVTSAHDLYQAGAGGAQAFNAFGGTSSLVSVDAMQEFRVETSSFAPEFGRSPGAQVLITTRSGTNQFHGTLFDYFRNDVLDASDWFNGTTNPPIPKAKERQNDFGGVFGGPIWHDKTFFFFSYEGLRLLQPQTSVITVPSQSLRASAVPAAVPVLDSYPLPNGPSIGDGSLARFTGSYSNQLNMDAASLKLDHDLGHGIQIFGRFNWSPSEALARAFSLTSVQKSFTNTRTLTLGLNQQISPSIFNSIRANFSNQTAGQSFSLDSFGGATPLNTAVLLPSPYSPATSAAAVIPLDLGGAFLDTGRSSTNVGSQFNLLDDFSAAKGAHRLKAGIDFRQIALSASGTPISAGYLLSTTEGFANSGTAFLATFRSFQPGKIALHNISTYVQDQWNIGRRTTITYGVRWDVNAAPSVEDNTVLASWRNVNTPQTSLAPLGTPIFGTTFGNLAPRAGVAYRLNEKGDFVLRAGWGLFYDLPYSIAPLLLTTFPNLASGTAPNVSIPDPNFMTHAQALTFSTTPPFNSPFINIFDPNLELPYSQQWNVAVEKSLFGKQTLSASYVGQSGQRLIRQEGVPSPNASLPQGYVLVDNSANSNYNALQLQFRRPIGRVQALVNYTWSHSIDTASNDIATNISSLISPVQGDRGSSDFDVRHNFTGTMTYAVPGAVQNRSLRHLTDGWSLAGIFDVRSGLPIEITTGRFAPAISRPDFDPTQPIWISDPSSGPGRKLNPLAFPIPGIQRQGTLPRNLIYGLGASQIDLSLRRRFVLTEKIHLDFRTDAFNVLNHPNFANPDGNVDSSQFGRFTAMLNKGLQGVNPLYQIGGPRSLQLSMKLEF